MKFVIQRVTSASCCVDNKITGEINRGFLVFIGVSDDDTTEIADKMTKKLLGLRIFEDENGKTNLALKDVNGECGFEELQVNSQKMDPHYVKILCLEK